MSVLRAIAMGMIRGYQLLVSPFLAPCCRFHPSCSEYALEAVARHGILRGGVLTLIRLGRCHPWGGSGYEPVPDHPTFLGRFGGFARPQGRAEARRHADLLHR